MACSLAHIPWPLLSSDHLSFRLRGMANAVTLSLVPGAEVARLARLTGSLNPVKLLLGQRPALPLPLSTIHTPQDTSQNLSESSLEAALSLLLAINRLHAQKKPDV